MIVAVIGLGYVGLPLVVEFGKHVRTIGYDIDVHKVGKCKFGVDPSKEISHVDMLAAVHAEYTNDAHQLKLADFIIVAVPTPVNDAHIPDFGPLLGASRVIGENMRPGATIIFESTVYPGATEEVCIPEIMRASTKQNTSTMLVWKHDFNVGYSPERINPGDKGHSLTKVMKVVSGDTPKTLDKAAALYEMIVTPGVHRATSIKVAEASKVIENTQRDLNIALMNELAIIFDKVGIDTLEVLEAAGTKWNFMPFRPGLVGGHCIGVDPYYLTHKAEQLGYHPQVILAGRRINDSMGKYIAEQTIKQMIQAGLTIKGATVTVLGLTFKENCADVRNTKVVDIIRELESYGVTVQVHDPEADPHEVLHEYGIKLTSWQNLTLTNCVIAAVAHKFYHDKFPLEAARVIVIDGCFIDVKSAFDIPNVRTWRL